jgi:predicted Zn-dependent peptidase
MVVAAVGRLDHHEIVALVEQWLGGVPSGGSPRNAVALPSSEAVRDEKHAGRSAAHIVIGSTTPGLNSEWRYALNVTAAILGRAGRRLRRELRDDRALTYAVSARFGALSDVGIFSIATSVDAARWEEAFEVIKGELRRLRESGVTEQELQMAQGFLEGRTYLLEERHPAQARRIAGQELLGFPMTLEKYVERIHGVTREDIAQVSEYLDPGRAVSILVRP